MRFFELPAVDCQATERKVLNPRPPHAHPLVAVQSSQEKLDSEIIE
jgi:hypothetical protein